ncbi:glycosyltransferase [Variovorax sp. RCC_210]|uniref:glycosyltransferase n=1 Tax=Variovorax sp. RCC_210 TaxID=3239217 RepID=UPI00352687FB
MPAISVIIVAFKSEKDICSCIDSIFENLDIGRDELEIIVVDNSPADSARKISELISGRYATEVKYFLMEENLGYGRGNNFGVSVCRSNLICVMNPDVRLKSPLFALAKERFLHDTKLAMLGFRQTGGRNLSFYFYPEIFWPLIGVVFLKIFNFLNFFSPRWFFTSGALVFLDKEKFIKVGGYDEDIFLYCEDSDLCRRFVNSGCGLGYESSIAYDHQIDLSQRRGRTNASLSFEYESMSHYFRKHGFSKRWYYAKRLIDFRIKEFIFLILRKSARAGLKREFLLFGRVFLRD